MKITFEIENLSGSFTGQPDNQWKLVARDAFENIHDEKKVSLREMAAILFCMHDEHFESLEEIERLASETLKEFKVAILP